MSPSDDPRLTEIIRQLTYRIEVLEETLDRVHNSTNRQNVRRDRNQKRIDEPWQQ